MGGETKKGEGGRRSERKEEREAGDGESNKYQKAEEKSRCLPLIV